MSFDPFEQEFSTEGVDANSILEDDHQPEVVVLGEDKPAESAHAGSWSWAMGADMPLPDSRKFFAYDLEAVPDYHFERPEEKKLEDVDMDASAVLKTETTVKARLGEGLNKEQAGELLLLEQQGKQRKGVISALVSHIENGDKDLKAWKDLAKNPATARIVAMGICDIDDPLPRVWLAQTPEQERQLLEAFLEQHARGRIRTGYNIASYDDRLIAWRCMKLGIPMTHKIHCARFGGKQSVDIALKLFSGVQDMMKLKTLLPMLGIDPPAADVDGSMVLDMVDGGQWEDLAGYVASDAWSEMELFKRVQAVMEL